MLKSVFEVAEHLRTGSLVRVLPGDAALDIDRRRERRLRPSVVVASLAAAQARPSKGKPEALLESLVAAYELLAAREERPDPVLRRWRNAVFVIFWLTGFIFASWATRVPNVRDILDASTGQMGLLILGLAAGSVLGANR